MAGTYLQPTAGTSGQLQPATGGVPELGETG